MRLAKTDELTTRYVYGSKITIRVKMGVVRLSNLKDVYQLTLMVEMFKDMGQDNQFPTVLITQQISEEVLKLQG